jgi:hypothetical protein
MTEKIQPPTHKAIWPKSPTRWIADKVLHVSIPFTWNITTVVEEIRNPSPFWDSVLIGGPAVYLMPHKFDGLKNVTIGKECPGALQKVNPYATKTTTGCIRKCPWCVVRRVEGPLKVLDDWPDLPILTDNNLLGAPLEHFDKVIDRLVSWGWCDFNQGLDTRIMTPYHAKRIAEIKQPVVKIALDDMSYAKEWELATILLREAGVPKSYIRTLVLIGFNSGPKEAWDRLHYVKDKGFHPRPMWFHELDAMDVRVVTPKQQELGWTNAERVLITGYFYAGKMNEEREYVQKQIAAKKYWFFEGIDV